MYIYGIGCGLMPAPLKKGQFLLGYKQRWYLIYTACLHGGLLTILPFTFPHYMYDDSYMSSNPVLKWTFNLTNITRIMAMFSGVLLMWFRRKRLLDLGENLILHCLKCEKLDNHSKKYSKLRKRVRNVLFQMLLVANLSILLGALILFRIHSVQRISKTAMIVAHITQFIYVVFMMTGICVILLVLHWQSERLQIAFKDLCSFLNHEERNSLTLSENKANRSLGKLAKLFKLFAENQRLVREVFRTFDLPIALLLLKMFVTNVNLVYHGVQFGNDTIETSSYTRIVGQWVVISHYWSAVLLMNVVDDVTRRRDLKMGDLLREFSHLELVKRDFHLQVAFFW